MLKTRHHGKIIGAFFVAFIHGVITQGLFVPMITSFLLAQTENYLLSMIDILTFPVIAMVVISWLFIHIKFFYFPLTTIEKNIAKISEGIKNGRYKTKLMTRIQNSVLKKLINRKGNIISSTIIGTIYIYCEVQLWLLLKNEMMEPNPDSLTIYICLSLFALNPTFIIFGITLVVSNFKKSNKFLVAPLFFGTLPMIGIIPLYNNINSVQQLSNLALILLLGFPVNIVFWMSLILTGVRYKTLFYSSITYMCSLILLPFAFLYLLNEINVFADQEIVTYVVYVLGFIGAIIFLIVVFYLIWKAVIDNFIKNHSHSDKKTHNFNLGIYIISNLKNCGFWFNSFFFIGSFIGVLFAIYNRINSSAIEAGTVNNLINFITFFYKSSMVF